MKVAIIHDWLVARGGAERVLEQILQQYPDADLYTVVDFMSVPDRAWLKGRSVRTSFIQSLPFSRRHYRAYLPLMPFAIEQWDLSGYNLVISSSHAVAKGVITGPDQLHVSYVHSPMRYAWDLCGEYLRQTNLDGVRGWPVRWILYRMRLWDQISSQRVDFYMSNSSYVSRRIQKFYRRDSVVVPPPVRTDIFETSDIHGELYLTVSRLVPYKRVDLIAEAFSGMPNKKLVIIGDGPEMHKVKEKAGPNVTILGSQSESVVHDHLCRCRAFVFASEEDFGIAPLEAQACGKPVIAFGKGGCLETLIGEDKKPENPTAVFFYEQSVESLRQAVINFELESDKFKPVACRANAERFSPESFSVAFQDCIKKSIKKFGMDF